MSDDICVFSPSISGVRLLDICGDYAAKHETPLIATKQIVFFFPQKVYKNNLLHQMFFWTVYVYNFLTKWNTLVCG